jgi:hypothetical protein
MIARRADTKARADFATWKMMAKLNGTSSLPEQAQAFLVSYKALREKMSEADADNATIDLMYKSYYAEMGGRGTPPDVHAMPVIEPVVDNVTAFRRPVAKQARPANGQAPSKRPLPVALIFICLAIVYTGLRYLFR